MSTILKALKKVEGKRTASDVKLDMPEKPAVHRIKSYDGLKWIVAAGLLLMVAFSAAVGRYFWQTDKPTPIAQKAQGARKAADGIESQPSTSETPLPQEILPDKPMIKPVPAAPDFSPKKANGKINARKRGGIAPLAKKEPSKKVTDRPEPQKPAQLQGRPKAIGPSDTWPKADSTIERKTLKPDAPLLDDRSLEIQALVYSEDATKRMVVLNGEILRMGNEYKGYIIESIEPQWILVRKNGQVSALPFGH